MHVRLGIVTLSCLALAGCGDLADPAGQSFRVVGSVVVVDPAGIETTSPGAKGWVCQGRGPYADLVIDAPVVVQDAGGTAVARGKLGMGRMTVDLAQLRSGAVDAEAGQGCLMGLAIDGVPALGTTWTLHVGDRELKFSRDEAANLRLVFG